MAQLTGFVGQYHRRRVVNASSVVHECRRVLSRRPHDACEDETRVIFFTHRSVVRSNRALTLIEPDRRWRPEE